MQLAASDKEAQGSRSGLTQSEFSRGAVRPHLAHSANEGRFARSPASGSAALGAMVFEVRHFRNRPVAAKRGFVSRAVHTAARGPLCETGSYMSGAAFWGYAALTLIVARHAARPAQQDGPPQSSKPVSISSRVKEAAPVFRSGASSSRYRSR